jgi:hypothetical protein
MYLSEAETAVLGGVESTPKKCYPVSKNDAMRITLF